MTPTATRHMPSDDLASVPFTRDSLDCLRALAVRFNALARPLPEHSIIEIALRRLYYEYCPGDKDIQPSDQASIRLIKRNSMQVLQARYREYCDLETVILRKRRTA
jgi:hypothetical protein